jgi:propanediol dehydratase small subunit
MQPAAGSQRSSKRAQARAARPEILAIYESMRPGRSDPVHLYQIASDLEARYGATRCARLIRDAADAYLETSPSKATHG